MPRLLMIALAALIMTAAACGGGGDSDDEQTATPDPNQPAATATPPLLPTPPTAPDDEAILNVSAGENVFSPTPAEFRDLPTKTIDAGGNKEGVTLAEMGRRVSAPAGAIVNLQGFRRDGRAIQFVRQPLAEIGEESVLTIDDSGRISFFSARLGENEWLVNVTVVTFQ